MTWILALAVITQFQFPHDIHAQNEVECLDCHTAVQTSTQSSDLLLPSESLCLDCHDTSQGYERPSAFPLWISKFSHQAHRSSDCLTCHESAESPVMPVMSTCASCHNGQKAPNPCTQCHELTEKRLQVYHSPGWKSFHAEKARVDETSCFLCHDEDAAVRPQNPAPTCGSCHTQENFALKVHPQNYKFLHPQEFEAQTQNCASCHTGFETCRECHEKERVYPMEHNLLDWVQTEEGGIHAQEAEANPERCLVCHSRQEGTCATCHAGGN